MVLVLVLILSIFVTLCACDGLITDNNNDNEADNSKPEIINNKLIIHNGEEKSIHELGKDDRFIITDIKTKIGYNFSGFYDKATGGNKIFDNEGIQADDFKISGQLDVYAQYLPKKYTMILDATDFAVSDPNREVRRQVEYDSAVELMPICTAVEGYAFEGRMLLRVR